MYRRDFVLTSKLMQGGSIFCSPRSATHKPKLRLLYECAPLAMVVEAAGGAAIGAHGAILDQTFHELDETCVIALGEPTAVERCKDALRHAL
jgi:fructose-1,6-bisphosphatase